VLYIHVSRSKVTVPDSDAGMHKIREQPWNLYRS